MMCQEQNRVPEELGARFSCSELGSCVLPLPMLYCQSENESEYASLGKSLVELPFSKL